MFTEYEFFCTLISDLHVVFKKRGDVAVGDVVSGHGGVGRSDFRGFFPPLRIL